VIIPDISTDHKWGPCFWQAKDNMNLPVVGNAALVTFDNRRAPWVSAWWTGQGPNVVNGQWVKGVNGAAVWRAIAVPDLPQPLVLRAGGTSGSQPISSSAQTQIPEMIVTGTFVGNRPVLVVFKLGFQTSANSFVDVQIRLDGAAVIGGGGDDGVFGVQTWANTAAAQSNNGSTIIPSVTSGPHTISLTGQAGAAGGNWFSSRRHLHVMEM